MNIKSLSLILLLLAILVVGGVVLLSQQQTPGDNEVLDSSQEIENRILIENEGGSREGHTPRGFAGMGTGLFAGDNLNPNFPEGDGVQIFLTFDLSSIPEGSSIRSALLRSDSVEIRGTPFEDLGALNAEEVRYEAFAPDLWDLEGGETSCVFATSAEGPFECDVRETIFNSMEDGYPYAQFRLRFDEVGDGDGMPDMALFFKQDSNTNESGIFELEIVLEEDTDEEGIEFGDDALEVIRVPVILHIATESGEVSSKRTPEEVRSLFRQSESIWAQANIAFDVSVEETILEESLQKAVLAQDFRALYSLLGTEDGKIHIFYVDSLYGPNGIALLPSLALVADHTTVHDFRATAHEIGHLLGLRHTRESDNRLLYSGTNGILLAKEEVERARAIARLRTLEEDRM